MEEIRKVATNNLATGYYTSLGGILLPNLQGERAAPQNLSQMQNI